MFALLTNVFNRIKYNPPQFECLRKVVGIFFIDNFTCFKGKLNFNAFPNKGNALIMLIDG